MPATQQQPVERFVEANGIRHRLMEQGSGPLVFLLHGFPEGWRSWEQQMRDLAQAGYRAVAPDARGYGRTEAPNSTESYRTQEHVRDVVALTAALGETSAVVVGHDWGAVTAWNCALQQPACFRGVAALSIPLTPRSPAPPLAVLRERFKDRFFYMLYFQEPGVAEAELEADVRRSLRLFLHAASGEAATVGAGFYGKPPQATVLAGMHEPEVQAPWLTPVDFDVAATEFERTGFRGALGRYRNLDRDWEDTAAFAGAKITIPAAFAAGDRDLTFAANPQATAVMRAEATDLREVLILPGAGHWLQRERAAEVSALLLRFLSSLN